MAALRLMLRPSTRRWLLTGAGVLMLVGAFGLYSQAQSGGDAVPVKGTIVSSGVAVVGDQYRPDVCYRYAWKGVIFGSTRYSTVAERGTKAWAEEQASRYVAEQPCTVLVEPQHPEQGVLVRPDASRAQYASLAFAVIGLLFIAWGGSSRDNPAAPQLPHP